MNANNNNNNSNNNNTYRMKNKYKWYEWVNNYSEIKWNWERMYTISKPFATLNVLTLYPLYTNKRIKYCIN